MVVAPILGQVLRTGIRETWQQSWVGWFQYCDAIECDADGFVVSIGGEPLDPGRLYHVGVVRVFFKERDSPTIARWFDENPGSIPDEDSGQPVHALLLSYFAELVWTSLWDVMDNDGDGAISLEELQALDRNGDGEVDACELMAALKEKLGFSTAEGVSTFVDTLLEIAGDADHDGKLSLSEINATHKRRVQQRTTVPE